VCKDRSRCTCCRSQFIDLKPEVLPNTTYVFLTSSLRASLPGTVQSHGYQIYRAYFRVPFQETSSAWSFPTCSSRVLYQAFVARNNHTHDPTTVLAFLFPFPVELFEQRQAEGLFAAPVAARIVGLLANEAMSAHSRPLWTR
jgi:hypothetical protein